MDWITSEPFACCTWPSRDRSSTTPRPRFNAWPNAAIGLFALILRTPAQGAAASSDAPRFGRIGSSAATSEIVELNSVEPCIGSDQEAGPQRTTQGPCVGREYHEVTRGPEESEFWSIRRRREGEGIGGDRQNPASRYGQTVVRSEVGGRRSFATPTLKLKREVRGWRGMTGIGCNGSVRDSRTVLPIDTFDPAFGAFGACRSVSELPKDGRFHRVRGLRMTEQGLLSIVECKLWSQPRSPARRRHPDPRLCEGDQPLVVRGVERCRPPCRRSGPKAPILCSISCRAERHD